jgi:hypothetical protein
MVGKNTRKNKDVFPGDVKIEDGKGWENDSERDLLPYIRKQYTERQIWFLWFDFSHPYKVCRNVFDTAAQLCKNYKRWKTLINQFVLWKEKYIWETGRVEVQKLST